MAMLMLNGQAICPPSALKLTVFDACGEVKRNAAGNAVMDRSVPKRKLELTWAYLPGGELAEMLSAMNGFFDVIYPDPQDGEMRAMCCYCGERATGILRMQDGVPVWTDVKMIWLER